MNPVLANEEIVMGKRRKWYAEELRVMAREADIPTNNKLFPEKGPM